MKKIDNMQDQMGIFSRVVKIILKNQKKMLEIKNTKIKNVFDSSQLDSTQPKKEPVNLKIG